MIFLSWELLVLPECIVRNVLPLLHLIYVHYCLFSSVQFTCIMCMLHHISLLHYLNLDTQYNHGTAHESIYSVIRGQQSTVEERQHSSNRECQQQLPCMQ